MSLSAIRILTAICLILAVSAAIGAAGQSSNAVDTHVKAAQAAAGQDFKQLLIYTCPGQPPRPTGQAGQAPPPREQWHAEPMKVFDNMYFVGSKVHGAWAITTSDGIIVIDALYEYAVADEVEGGIKKLGLDPTKIKYLIVTHGHGDHAGGVKYLQDKYKPRVVMGPGDWDLVKPAPRRDMVATDGQKITLGDTTVTLYITPGHTPSTISLIVPVKDGGRPHIAAQWGGTAISDATSVEMLRAYIDSANRFRDISVKAGADVIFINHTDFINANAKLAALASRKPGAPHPFVVGADAVKRYLTIPYECGQATLAKATTKKSDERGKTDNKRPE